MRARLLWTLMLLAAVFAVHGPSCAAADSDMTGMSMTAAAAESPAPAGPVLGPAAVVDHHAAAMDTAATSRPKAPSSSMHALMVCLAVLAGGVGAVLAALAAWVGRRRVLTAHPHTVARLRVTLDRAVACAPAPELSRLCVLRV